MVDPVNLRLGKTLPDCLVDCARRGEIVTQRFLKHDAAVRVDQAVVGQGIADQGKQAGRRGQIVDMGGTSGQTGFQGWVSLSVAGIELQVVEAGREARPDGGIEAGSINEGP